MGNTTVSFILPVYNVEPYLRECLDSILRQSLNDYEIILINDGSKDNSLAICKEYEAAHDNIKVIDQPNSGVSVARNTGMKAAQGKYICFMDADDFYSVDFAGDFYDTCERESLDIIRGFYRFYDEKTGTFGDGPKKELSYYNKVLSGDEFLIKSIREETHEVVPVGGFFRREYLIDNDIWFPKGIIFEEDQIFFMEALLKQPCRIMQTPVEFYAYRKHEGSATTTPSIKKAEDVGTIVSMELSLARRIKNRVVRRFAKHFAGSSFFQLTCIYGLMPKTRRKEIRRICDFRTKLCCAFHAATRHQRIKNALFFFAPWLVDLVYDLRKKNG